MVSGPRAIQNTLSVVSISNRTRDTNPLKIDFWHLAFWDMLVTRTAVCVPIDRSLSIQYIVPYSKYLEPFFWVFFSGTAHELTVPA